MKLWKIITISVVAAVIVIGLIVGLLVLPRSQSGIIPGEKVMADTMAYLMELRRRLEELGINTPELCWCCENGVITGICPKSQGQCCEATEGGVIPRDIPVDEVEVSTEDAGEDGGGDGY